MDLKIYFGIFICVVSRIQSANILGVFPIPSISHQVVFRKITQGLATRGHNVTVLTPDPVYTKEEAPANYKEIDVHEKSYKMIGNFFTKVPNIVGNAMTFNDIRQYSMFLKEVFVTQFETKGVQELIAANKKFDLILIESGVRLALVYSYIFKTPVILISSFTAVFNNHKVMGSPNHPLLYPAVLRDRFYNLSLIEKIRQLYIHYSFEYADYLNELEENIFLREMFGPQCPTLYEMSNKVDMLLLNINSMWADNQPVSSNVIYMGGIHQLPEKELPRDLKTYLDSSINGVIYVSFGTNVLSDIFPKDKLEVLINVLSRLPYDILWKWDKDELPRKGSNIKLSKWLPQSDLLRHKKIKLFITQAGLQSTDEAITAAVPLLAIPIMGDQWYNAEKYEKYGIGIKLDIKSLTEDQLSKGIETVINEESYRQNVAKFRDLIHDQPETPLNRTLWWIEHVLRHGGAKHLRSPAANMSYVEYFEIKLIFIIILSIGIFLAVFAAVVVILISKLFSSKTKLKIS